MKKVLLLACLGSAIWIGGCAPKPKVEPEPAPKTAETPAAGKDYMGASGGTGAAAPASGSGMGSPVMGTIPESAPSDVAPHSGTGTGSHSTASGSHASTGTKVTTAKPTGTVHGVKYTVKKGETLSAIAKKHYGKAGSATIKKIVAANPGMNPDKIRVGQSIVLP